ncbi:MAG: polysaccharide deacetylase family protein [Alphaproteobacteria bacterium]|nr:polysaccharide deacetylase family protein [Alphaproteobacteria bacterium]
MSDGEAWTALGSELAQWPATGRQATFWWRDDDAILPSAALDRLLALRARFRVPLALAVIPAPAEPALASRLSFDRDVLVLQHGWRHLNHRPQGERAAELGEDRPADTVLDEARQGHAKLARLFSGRFLPVMVPPWNRIAPGIAAALGDAGLRGLSTFGPRPRDALLAQVNAHVDPVAWRAGRGFVGAAKAVGMAIAHLQARRAGKADPDEPTGLLTHHLAHDEAVWDFAAAFLAATVAHPAARWVAAAEAFGFKPA